MAGLSPPKPRVLATRPMMPDVEARLDRIFRVTRTPNGEPMPREEMLRLAPENDALLVSSLDKFGQDFIDHLPPSIRIIATHSVGYDHLNIPKAEKRGIAVTNTPDVLTDATADSGHGQTAQLKVRHRSATSRSPQAKRNRGKPAEQRAGEQ